MGDDYLSLAEIGVSEAELRTRYPWIEVLTGHDGRPCISKTDAIAAGLAADSED